MGTKQDTQAQSESAGLSEASDEHPPVNRELDSPEFPPDITSHSTQDCAIALKCSDRTVRRLVQAGQLSAFRIGDRLIRITQSSIRNYIVSRRVSEDER